MRGVAVPPGWVVHGGSLLVWAYGERRPASKIAAFDFDGCLAATPLGGNDPAAWRMQFAHVPATLRALSASGHAVIVVTNESMDRFKKPDAISGCVRKKCGRLEGFARAVGVPLLVLCATAKDDFRKPQVGAWAHFCATLNGGRAVDRAASFFVGDAAGRPHDHSDSDRAFAAAAGLPFFDEKDFFLRRHPAAARPHD